MLRRSSIAHGYGNAMGKSRLINNETEPMVDAHLVKPQSCEAYEWIWAVQWFRSRRYRYYPLDKHGLLREQSTLEDGIRVTHRCDTVHRGAERIADPLSKLTACSSE